MAVQRAVVVQEIEKPCVLVHDRAVPEPKKDEVQIKGQWLLTPDPSRIAAGYNDGLLLEPQLTRIIDWGLLISDMLPAVLANDVVGKVIKLGDGVAGFAVGDRVMSQGASSLGFPQTGLQEYATAGIGSMAKIPRGTTDDDAATIPTNLCSVFIALFLVLELPVPWAQESQPTDQLLIVGGGSNCGQFAVQLAKLAGISKIVVVGGDEKHVKSLGATHVIDRHGSEDAVLRSVRAAVGDNLIYAFDTVNLPDGLGLALNALSKNAQGKLARLLPLRAVDEKVSKGHAVLDVLGNVYYQHPLIKELWKRLPGYLENGSIRPTAYAVKTGLEADVVNAALNEYRDGGKVIKPHIHV